MREFTQYDKEVMAKLVKSEAGFAGLLSHEFRTKVRLLLHFQPSGNVRYEYRSDDYPKEVAIDELTSLIELLEYLLSEKLIRKKHPTVTSLEDFTVPNSLSLGDSQSIKTETILLNEADSEVAYFVREHRNYTFEGTQNLKTLAKDNFENWDRIKHRQTKQLAIGSMVVSILGSILIPIVIYYLTYNKDRTDFNNQIQVVRTEMLLLKKRKAT